MDRTEHSVMATTIIGGLHPDAIQVVEGIGGVKVGIHMDDDQVHVSLFGTLDDLVAVNTSLARELARIAAARIPDPTIERIGTT